QLVLALELTLRRGLLSGRNWDRRIHPLRCGGAAGGEETAPLDDQGISLPRDPVMALVAIGGQDPDRRDQGADHEPEHGAVLPAASARRRRVSHFSSLR